MLRSGAPHLTQILLRVTDGQRVIARRGSCAGLASGSDGGAGTSGGASRQEDTPEVRSPARFPSELRVVPWTTSSVSPGSSRFPSGVYHQKGRKAVGHGHRDTEATRHRARPCRGAGAAMTPAALIAPLDAAVVDPAIAPVVLDPAVDAAVLDPVTLDPAVVPETPQRAPYRCECGHELRVFGVGRHRIYFMPGDATLEDPVMNRVCPECGRGLPGKNAPERSIP